MTDPDEIIPVRAADLQLLARKLETAIHNALTDEIGAALLDDGVPPTWVMLLDAAAWTAGYLQGATGDTGSLFTEAGAS